MKGIILAGGTGSRLRPITHTGPKQLIPIANKPNIQYCIDDLRSAGIADIAVILGNNSPEKIQSFLKNTVTYIHQGEPKGIAHAVLLAKNFIDSDNFVVYLGDNILKESITPLIPFTYPTILLAHVKNPQRFGIAEIHDDTITNLTEKPENPVTDLGIVGIYLFTPEIFTSIETIKPSSRGELELTDAIQHYIAHGGTVKAHIVTDWWKDTGSPNDILEANRLVLQDIKPSIQGEVHPSCKIIGNVSIGKNSVVLDKCVIKGPVIIGENSRITEGAYIGPYTSIGDNCNLNKTQIEDSIVMNNTKIFTHQKIIESLIGEHVCIDSSTYLNPRGNRLIVGENSMVSI